jgi:glycosyltransferase involved in cell wall biosynthesis
MVKALQAAGHSVLLLTGKRSSAADYGLGRSVEFARTLPWPGAFHLSFLLSVCARVRRLVRAGRVDVVVFDPLSAVAILGALAGHRRRARANALGVTLLMDVRSLPAPGRRWAARGRRVLFRMGVAVGASIADGVTTISPALHEELIHGLGLSGDKPWTVWSSAVDAARFDPGRFSADDVGRLRSDLGLSDKYVVLYHGAMDVRRGLDALVQSFAVLRARGDERARLLLVGGDYDVEALRSLVARESLVERVVFVDTVPYEMVPLYVAAADAGVVPLPDEAIWRTSSPLKLFEYLAMEKPVIVSDIRAHRDLLQPSQGACFMRGFGPDAIAAAMESVMAWDGDAVRAKGAAARDMVMREYSWSSQAGKLLAFVGELRDGAR